MRVVADCDEIMKTTLLSMSARDQNCAAKIGELDKDVVEFMEECKQAYDSSLSGDLTARLATRSVDSAKLFKHFRRLTKVATVDPNTFGLDDAKIERLRELRKASAQYAVEVLGKRNILGHVAEVQGENGWVLQGSSEIAVRDFADIRQAFAAHLDAFREIMRLVTSLDGEQA